jgi:hypothetical protein
MGAQSSILLRSSRSEMSFRVGILLSDSVGGGGSLWSAPGAMGSAGAAVAAAGAVA